MNPERIGLTVLLFVIVMAVAVARPPSSVNGLNPIEQNPPRFHLMRGTGDGDGTFDIVVPGEMDSRTGSFVLYDGRLWEDAKRPHTIKATFTPDFYFVDPGLDLGTIAAYRPGSTDDTSAFQVGIRYSPVRFAWGTVSTDIIVTGDVAGGGFSLFPPPRILGGFWQHLGLGAWYTVPFGDDTGDDSSQWCYGMSFSTRDF